MLTGKAQSKETALALFNMTWLGRRRPRGVLFTKFPFVSSRPLSLIRKREIVHYPAAFVASSTVTRQYESKWNSGYQTYGRNRSDFLAVAGVIGLLSALSGHHTSCEEAQKFPRIQSFQTLKFKEVRRMTERYNLGEVIGEGTFAKVRVATDKNDGREVAIKEVNKKHSDQQALENEVLVLKATGKHENIISLIDVYDSEETLYIVTDLANGGELFDKIIEEGELSEQYASKMMREAVNAIRHLHEQNIIHLDIKPENLLLSNLDNETNIKLADFGLAIQLPGAEYQLINAEVVGTPAYWAPELVQNEAFGKGVDIWALGCVLYILLCGSHPFDPYGDASESKILSRVVKGDFDTDNTQYLAISPQGKDLLSHMLDPDPETRYNARQVSRHPWMSESDQILSSTPLPNSHINKLKANRAVQLMRMGLQIQAGNNGDTVEAVLRMFSQFDENNDGVLSKKELSQSLKMLGINVSNKDMDDMYKVFDVDEDGKITLQDFQNVVLLLNQATRAENSLQQLKYLFDVIDKDKDGYIEKDDCMRLMDSLGYADKKSELFRKMQRFQTTGTKDNRRKNSGRGQIDFSEFVRYFRQVERETRKKGIVHGAGQLQKHTLRTSRKVTAKTKSGSKEKTYIPGCEYSYAAASA